MKHKLLIFASGAGTNFKAVVEACNSGIIPAEVVALAYNKEAAGCATLAKELGIETYFVPWERKVLTRYDYDKNLSILVNDLGVDLVVLAGWMHILDSVFLNGVRCPVINLHPALPGQFPGKDAIGDAWTSYCNSKIKETGVMVHHVVPEIDAGEVIETITVPILLTDTKESLTTRVKALEKSCLINGICKVLLGIQTKKEHPLLYTGKTRSVYDIGHNFLAISCSDRLSAFDIFRCHVNHKGTILTETTAWWFEQTKAICKNHYLYHYGNNMIVHRTEPILVEVIIRGYLAGSCWKAYQKGQRTWGDVTLPEGLTENQKLPQLILTPTTKAAVGEHDEDITEDSIIARLCSKQNWHTVKTNAFRLFRFGEAVCQSKGLTLVDTKFEFGLDRNDDVMLIDEIFTCDSSRFWLGGDPKRKLDKDIIRDWVKTNNFQETNEIEVPPNLIERVETCYLQFYQTITDSHSEPVRSGDLHRTILKFYQHFVPYQVAIIAGSEKDKAFCDKLTSKLTELSIPSKQFFSSAHKQPQKVLDTLRSLNTQSHLGTKTVLITVAGRSNALSGFCGANSNFPVIACPPFADKTDMQVNVNSTLQMPSNVPVLTVLDPGNAALAAERILKL